MERTIAKHLPGDRDDGLTRPGQQFAAPLDPLAVELVGDAPAQVRAKRPVQRPTRDADGLGHFADAKRLGEMFPQVPQRPGRVQIRNRQHVGALAGHNASRRGHDELGRHRLAVHEPIEQLRRDPALCEPVRVYAGKRHRGTIADERVVAHSKHCHLLRNAPQMPLHQRSSGLFVQTRP